MVCKFKGCRSLKSARSIRIGLQNAAIVTLCARHGQLQRSLLAAIDGTDFASMEGWGLDAAFFVFRSELEGVAPHFPIDEEGMLR
jgi:hypothetical protein